MTINTNSIPSSIKDNHKRGSVGNYLKEQDCYITDYITEKIQAFRSGDTDEFKKKYIKAFYTFTSKDKDVFSCLKFPHHLVKPVQIIMEQKNG